MLFACGEAPGLWVCRFCVGFRLWFYCGFWFIVRYVVFELGGGCVVWFVLAVCLVFVLYLRWLFVAVQVFLP